MTTSVMRQPPFVLNPKAILRTQGRYKNLFRALDARKLRAQAACIETARPTQFLEGLGALLATLSSAYTPRFQPIMLKKLYQFILNPTESNEINLRSQLEGVCRATEDVNFDIDATLELAKTLKREFSKWQSQMMNFVQLHNLQMHDTLKAHSLHSPEFNAELKTHLGTLRAHIHAVVSHATISSVPEHTHNDNASDLLNHIRDSFIQEALQETLHFVYKRKFGTDSAKFARYFHVQKGVPQAALFKASFALKHKEMELKGSPEHYFEGCEAIKTKKQELVDLKDGLNVLIQKHKELFVQENELRAQKHAGQAQDPLTGLEDEEKATLVAFKLKKTPTEGEIAATPLSYADRQAFKEDKIEKERKLVEHEIATLKIQCEKCEYEVQMARLAFTRANEEVIAQALRAYYEQKVASLGSQNSTHFHFHYDITLLAGHDIAKLAQKLDLDPDKARARFLQSGYAAELKINDAETKQQMSTSEHTSKVVSKTSAKKQLASLEKSKFYLPGAQTYVQGLDEAIDLYIAATRLTNHPEYQAFFQNLREKVFRHIIQIKSEIYVAKAKLEGKTEQSDLKNHLESQLADDIQGINFTHEEKAPSLLIKELYEKAQLSEEKQAEAQQVTHNLTKMYQQAMEKAKATIKAELVHKTKTTKLHSKPPFKWTLETTLNDLYAHFPGRIAQFDQVLIHFRERHGVAHTNEVSSLVGMAPHAIAPGGHTHEQYAKRYATLPIGHVLKQFHPLIDKKMHRIELTRVIRELRQITYAPVMNEMAFDYYYQHKLHKHTRAPVSLEHLELPLTKAEKTKLELAYQVSHRFAGKQALSYYPHIEALVKDNPALFYRFGNTIDQLRHKLETYLTLTKREENETRMARKLKSLKKKTRDLTRDIIDHAIANIAVNAEGSLHLQQTVEELGYLLESVFANTLHKAMKEGSISSYILKALASQLQTSIQKGLIDKALSGGIFLENRSGEIRPGFLANLMDERFAMDTVRVTSPELQAPFAVGHLQQSLWDGFQAGYKLHLSRLYTNQRKRRISYNLIYEVLHETPAAGITTNPYLDQIRASFELYQEYLTFEKAKLSSNIASFNSQYQALVRAAAKVKQESARRGAALEQEVLEIKKVMLKRDFLMYEKMLGAAQSGWKASYDHAINITEQIMQYGKIDSEEVKVAMTGLKQQLQAKRHALKTEMEGQSPEELEATWAPILQQVVGLLPHLVRNDWSGAPYVHARTLRQINRLLHVNAA